VKWEKIICLAKSRKIGGYCIAGKEINSGEWVRPTSTRTTEEISEIECKLSNGKEIQVLDIVKVPFTKHKPNKFQTENYLITSGYNWQYIDKFDYKNLERICDFPENLWVIDDCLDCSSPYGKNDRIPENVGDNFDKSLYLITPDYLKIFIRTEYSETKYSKKRLRANFGYNKTDYVLAITDVSLEQYLLSREEAIYEIKNPKNRLYMCVSIGLPYERYCYKFVASIIPYEVVLKELRKIG